MEDKWYEYKAMNDKLYCSLPSKEEVDNKMIRDCLDALYRNSIPSISLEELEENYRRIKEEKGEAEAQKMHTYQGYFCPSTIQKQIIEHYLNMYNYEKKWTDYVDIILRDLAEGPTIDKYIKDDEDSPGYRGYEHLQPILEKFKEIVGDDDKAQAAYDQVVDYITKSRNFYRFEYKIDNIHFSIWNVAPNTSMESTIKYRHENGDPDFNITEEEVEKKYFYQEDDDDEYYCEGEDEQED